VLLARQVKAFAKNSIAGVGQLHSQQLQQQTWYNIKRWAGISCTLPKNSSSRAAMQAEICCSKGRYAFLLSVG
jgi:hypothetical protein